MPTNTNPAPRRPSKILRCDACGRSIGCTSADIVRYVQKEWPVCCGWAMRFFVEAELPTPPGLRRPPIPKSQPREQNT